MELSHGTVPSKSAFCQVSGFFLTLGIEASDIAVIFVALHTALYIFLGKNGLYPYRQAAYSAWVGLPLLLSALAFRRRPAFVNSGEFCYLPADSSGRALSWIPRYFIFATLFATYAYIYAYVTILVKRFGTVENSRGQSLSPQSGREPQRRRTASVPPIPTISYHGLIPSTPSSIGGRHQRCDSRHSVSSLGTTGPSISPKFPSLDVPSQSQAATMRSEHRVKWQTPHFGQDSATLSYRDTESSGLGFTTSSSALVSPSLSGTQPDHTHDPLFRSSCTPAIMSPTRSDTAGLGFWNRSVAGTLTAPSRTSSMPNMLSALRRGPRSSSSASSVFLSPTELDATGMASTRDKIRWKLRLLFVYPMVYLAVWLVPFISHVMGGDSTGAPFWVALVSLISLCIQGTVDALVFCINEKPWHQPHRKSLRLSFGISRRGGAHDGTNFSVGRSKDEMLLDGNVARRRRDEELAERRLERSFGQGSSRDDWGDHQWRRDQINDEEGR